MKVWTLLAVAAAAAALSGCSKRTEEAFPASTADTLNSFKVLAGSPQDTAEPLTLDALDVPESDTSEPEDF